MRRGRFSRVDSASAEATAFLIHLLTFVAESLIHVVEAG